MGASDGDSQVITNKRKDGGDIIHPSEKRTIVREQGNVAPIHSPENTAPNIEAMEAGHKILKSSNDISKNRVTAPADIKGQPDTRLARGFGGVEIPEQELWFLEPLTEVLMNPEEMPDPEEFPEIFRISTDSGNENKSCDTARM